MKKISVEQRDWLIEELIEKTGGLGRDFSVVKSEIREILNRCSEDYLPPFITEISGGYVTFALGEYGNHCCIATEWNDHSGRISRAITAPQIKELIKNATKMIGYLEGNN